MDPASAATSLESLGRRLIEGLCGQVYGQREVIESLAVGLICGGHLLLEGPPGTAKTTLVKRLSELSGAGFRRIQLTPDMLPAEIVGASVYDLNSRAFRFSPGPVFTDLLLADEINRTPPKTQSALLEAMEERQVTVDGERHALSPLFTVMATLNPIEFEGTYPLPEAQLDRFMMKIRIDYPPMEAERRMLESAAGLNEDAAGRSASGEPLAAQTSPEEIMACRRALSAIRVDGQIMDYLLQILHDTRRNPALDLGCSPRAALALMSAARAFAALSGDDFVTPDHVKVAAPAVMRHRLILSAQAELDGLTADDIVRQTLGKIPAPK
ncbi:MAG: MoxR family ATPase [Vampirovibrionales bacterium]|nr:MoxR family ATPase [Vampirovibrionales bacterium]